MRRLLMTIEVEVDDGVYGQESLDEIAWFFDEVVCDSCGLILHSNEVGDQVGEIKKVISAEFLPNEKLRA